MAIDRTGISSLQTGAPEIKYTGDQGPKSPDQMLMASADPILVDEYNKYVFELKEIRPEATPMSFKDFVQQLMSESRMAEGGIARLGYANGGNPRLVPHTGADLLVKNTATGERPKYQPPGHEDTGWSPGVSHSGSPQPSGDGRSQALQAIAAQAAQASAPSNRQPGMDIHTQAQKDKITRDVRNLQAQMAGTGGDAQDYIDVHADPSRLSKIDTLPEEQAETFSPFTFLKDKYEKFKAWNNMKQRQNFLKQLGVGPGGLGDIDLYDEDYLLSPEGLAKLNELGYQDYLNRFQQPGGGGDGQGIASQYPYYIPPITQADATGQTVVEDPTIPVDPIRFASVPSEHDFSSQYFYGADGGRSGFAGGGIADLRQAYGLGKLVKKATKAISKVAKSPIGLAALSSFIPFGKNKASLFSRMFQGVPGVSNPGGDSMWSKMLGSMSSKPFPWILGASALGGLYTAMNPGDEEEPDWLKKWRAEKAAADAQFAGISDPSNLQSIRFADGGRIGYAGGGNGDDDSMVGISMSIEERWERIKKLLQQMEDIKSGKTTDPKYDPEDKAQGGRIGYADAGPVYIPEEQWKDPEKVVEEVGGELEGGLLGNIGLTWPPKNKEMGANLIWEIQKKKYGEPGGSFTSQGEVPEQPPMSMEETITALEAEYDQAVEDGWGLERFEEMGIYDKEDIRRRVELGFDQAKGPVTDTGIMKAAQGGRIGYDEGKKVLPHRTAALSAMYGLRKNAQEGGLMDLGGMEKDYRNEGGFVPIGGQERADDVPARLSKNEFVFTADAVRAAGGGDIDRGAEVMENVMENLEQGGQVSEESQGLEGARNMFATAQRLEGVL